MTRRRTTTRAKAHGLAVVLSVDEYRLALLGLIDFEGRWEALETAATFVVDGAVKAELVRTRLRPIADQLAALAMRDIDAVEMVGCRHWFRHQPCGRSASSPEQVQPDGLAESAAVQLTDDRKERL